MTSSKWLAEGKTAGSLKWNGNIDELKKFCKEALEVDELYWARNDGHNGDPFCCKFGEDINIRWFPTTKTLQFQGKEADSVKGKLLTSISSFNADDDSVNSARQSSASWLDANDAWRSLEDTRNLNMNESMQSEHSRHHCCCARISDELLNIREEMSSLSAGHRSHRDDLEEIQQLRVALTEKENTIRNLEDENKSYKLALNLLTKEIANIDPKVPTSENPGQNSDEGFKVVTTKTKKKTQKKTEKQKPASHTRTSIHVIRDDNGPSTANQKPRNGQDRKHVMVLGDSIIKNVEAWRIGRSTKTKTTIKSFPGASVADCYHYFKPPLESDPDQIIIHVGTNDLKSNSARDAAESIVDLATWTTCECPSATIAISELTTRGDQEELGSKVSEVNKILKKFCHQNDWQILSHQNIDESSLNRSKLHLNKKGTGLIASNLIKFISNDQ